MKREKLLCWLLVVIFAAFMSVPFLVPHCGFFALFGFVPLLCMNRIANLSGMRHVWIYHYAAFVLWNAATTFWVCNATIGGGLFAILANSLQMSVIFALFRVSERRFRGILPYIFLAVMWIAWERAYFSADISWPWLVLGNAFARSTASIQWYEFTGSLGGSLWIWLVNITVYRILAALSDGSTARWNGKATAAAAIWLVLIIAGPFVLSAVISARYVEKENPLETVIFQPNIDPYNKFQALTQQQQNDILIEQMAAELDGREQTQVSGTSALQNSSKKMRVSGSRNSVPTETQTGIQTGSTTTDTQTASAENGSTTTDTQTGTQTGSTTTDTPTGTQTESTTTDTQTGSTTTDTQPASAGTETIAETQTATAGTETITDNTQTATAGNADAPNDADKAQGPQEPAASADSRNPLANIPPVLLIAPETFTGDIIVDQYEASLTYRRFMQFLRERPGANLLFGASSYSHTVSAVRPSYSARQLNDGSWVESHNSALMIDGTGRTEIYHKSRLVVGVEMIPYPRFFSKVDDWLGGVMGRCVGQDDVTVFNCASATDTVKVGCAICYESVYGEYFTHYAKAGAEVMAIITNDAWWGDTPGYRQHLSYASLRAIETRRDIARCGNTGISGFIDQKGVLHDASPWWQQAVLHGSVNRNNAQTFFVRYGDITGRVCTLLFALLLLALIVNLLMFRAPSDRKHKNHRYRK